MSSHQARLPPHDRTIEVHAVEEGLWVRVRWQEQVGRLDVTGGDGVEHDEIEAWRKAPTISAS